MPMSKQVLIDGLNGDLAGEYAAIIQYIHYAATVTGPFRNELRAMFTAEVADEQQHAQYLADQVAILGGTPTTTARQVPSATTPRQMLQRIMQWCPAVASPPASRPPWPGRAVAGKPAWPPRC